MPYRNREWIGLCSLVLVLAGCKSKEEKPSQAEKRSEAILENPEAPAPESPLGVGASVWDFTALAHTGQQLKLSEFLDKPVVVYFCANDDAEACTQIALSFKDQWLNLNTKLSMVFGVSPQDTFVHRDFASTHKLPILMLADTEQSVHRVMGVKPGTVISYLINPDRSVRHVFSSVTPQTHAQQVLAVLQGNVPAAPSVAPTAAPSAAVPDSTSAAGSN